MTYQVHGTLKRLPKYHEIWLLVEDELTQRIWPQGFHIVQYDASAGRWIGKVEGGGKRIKIVAVVAPPTSQQFFRYFQEVGDHSGYKFTPLKSIPPECVIRHSVQAILP